MRQIISDIIEMLRGTTDLIQFEEDLKLYMSPYLRFSGCENVI